MLSLRVALAERRADRHRRASRATPSAPTSRSCSSAREGTLGIITRATLEIVPLPAERRFVTLQFPNVEAGIEAFRSTLAAGYRPSVIRMYDEEATARTLSPVVGETLDGVCAVVCCEGEPAAVAVEGSRTVELARAEGARELDPALAAALVGPPLRVLQAAAPPRAAGDLGHDRRRRHLHATSTPSTRRSRPPCATATPPQGLQLRMHFSHWYRWGTMIYARFLIPDGGAGRAARCTTGSGRTASPPCWRPAA